MDRSGTSRNKARKSGRFEHLAEQLRGEGASEATITKEIAKQTAGRDADLERNTQAQREHEHHIDKVLEPQRRRLLDAEEPHQIDRDQEVNRSTDERSPRTAEPDSGRDHVAEQAENATRDPYIEQAIQEARDGQQDRLTRTRFTARAGTPRARRGPRSSKPNQDGRDPYIEQAIQEARERQESWERGIDPDRDNDRGYAAYLDMPR